MVSLLYPAVKVLECLLQPELNSLPFSPNQHSFRPNHSTVSAILPNARNITQGFNLSCPHSAHRPWELILPSVLLWSTTSNSSPHWPSAYLKGLVRACVWAYVRCVRTCVWVYVRCLCTYVFSYSEVVLVTSCSCCFIVTIDKRRVRRRSLILCSNKVFQKAGVQPLHLVRFLDLNMISIAETDLE